MPALSLTLIEGTSFVICGGAGDIGDGPVDGVFVGDTRICDRLVLTLNGDRIEPLAATQPLPFQSVMVGRTRTPGIAAFREHWVGSGLRTDLRLHNYSPEPQQVHVVYAVGSDLAGLFEVKEGRAVGDRAPVWIGEGVIGLGTRDGAPVGDRATVTTGAARCRRHRELGCRGARRAASGRVVSNWRRYGAARKYRPAIGVIRPPRRQSLQPAKPAGEQHFPP